MTRNEYDIALCWDEETNEFDWDEYQYLCDCAEYWECEEQITFNRLHPRGAVD